MDFTNYTSDLLDTLGDSRVKKRFIIDGKDSIRRSSQNMDAFS